MGHGWRMKRSLLVSWKMQKKVQSASFNSTDMEKSLAKNWRTMTISRWKISRRKYCACSITINNWHSSAGHGQLDKRINRSWLSSGKKLKKVHTASLNSGEMEEQSTMHKTEAGELEPSADVIHSESEKETLASVSTEWLHVVMQSLQMHKVVLVSHCELVCRRKCFSVSLGTATKYDFEEPSHYNILILSQYQVVVDQKSHHLFQVLHVCKDYLVKDFTSMTKYDQHIPSQHLWLQKWRRIIWFFKNITRIE